MPDALGYSSEDEFPEVDVVVRQYRHRAKGRQPEGDCDDGGSNPKDVTKSTSRKETDPKNTHAVKATPLRRRKLGQGQPIDQSLLKPWGKTISSKEEKSQGPNSRGPRATVRVKEESIEADSSSKAIPEHIPPRARQQGHRGVSTDTDSKLLSKRAGKLQRNDNTKTSSVSTKPVSKSTKRSVLSDESSEESDMWEGSQESSDEVSEFVSGSESESDVWNSGSEHSVTPPTRSSRSPTVQWANPQRTLFKSPGKKVVPSNRQPPALITDPTNRPPKQRETLRTSKAPQPRNLEDVFQKLQIFNDDSEPDEPPVKGDRKPILEPTTPRKTLKTVPASPLKTPKIPASPWKPEHKEFWDSELHFGWIDKHSPEKKPESPHQKGKPNPKLTAQELRAEAKRKYGVSPEKKSARIAFDAVKEELARSFLRELDDRITDGELSRLTEDTGGLRIVWSNTLLSTAGRAHWKCTTLQTTTRDASGATTGRRETRQHSASIELATRVLGNESDLLNTVAHEFCHLAVFILSGKPKAPHGAEFKALGARCGRVFADRGIVVTTKHSYEIEYKYIWECRSCLSQVKRHSRSVEPSRQTCGKCRGALVQVKPVPRGGTSTPTTNGTGSGPATAKKKPSAWQEFVSLEMKALSQSNPGMTFKEKMAITSAKWNEMPRQQQKREKKQGNEQQEEKREKTMKELLTAVEVLNIDDDDDNNNDYDEEDHGAVMDQPKA